jgi:hypothetical protein
MQLGNKSRKSSHAFLYPPSFADNVVSSRYHSSTHSQAERERKKSFVFKEKRKRKTDFSRRRKWWDRVDRNSFSLDRPLYNSASAMAVGVPSSPISTLAKYLLLS